MWRIILALSILLYWICCASAQTTISGTTLNRSTVNTPTTITTANTFQQILPSILGTTTQRQALTIENNNASDNCWLFIGSGTATKAISMLLLPGGSYTRYWPYVPSDAFQATCASNSDTLYVDNQ
jgi:hypothetical protein